jgi:hypothetical protein
MLRQPDGDAECGDNERYGYVDCKHNSGK